jgi:hypothetical protein
MSNSTEIRLEGSRADNADGQTDGYEANRLFSRIRNGYKKLPELNIFISRVSPIKFDNGSQYKYTHYCCVATGLEINISTKLKYARMKP